MSEHGALNEVAAPPARRTRHQAVGQVPLRCRGSPDRAIRHSGRRARAPRTRSEMRATVPPDSHDDKASEALGVLRRCRGGRIENKIEVNAQADNRPLRSSEPDGPVTTLRFTTIHHFGVATNVHPDDGAVTESPLPIREVDLVEDYIIDDQVHTFVSDRDGAALIPAQQRTEQRTDTDSTLSRVVDDRQCRSGERSGPVRPTDVDPPPRKSTEHVIDADDVPVVPLDVLPLAERRRNRRL